MCLSFLACINYTGGNISWISHRLPPPASQNQTTQIMFFFLKSYSMFPDCNWCNCFGVQNQWLHHPGWGQAKHYGSDIIFLCADITAPRWLMSASSQSREQKLSVACKMYLPVNDNILARHLERHSTIRLAAYGHVNPVRLQIRCNMAAYGLPVV